MGIGTSGAADQHSLRLGNRLVGNHETAAGLEITNGSFAARVSGHLVIALTGAICPAEVGGRHVDTGAPIYVHDGDEIRMKAPVVGLRTYLCVQGGIDTPVVLGSRSNDVKADLGLRPVTRGAVLPIGIASQVQPFDGLAGIDLVMAHAPARGDVTLRIIPGPRGDWFTDSAMERLTCSPYEVAPASDRIGMRLKGPRLERTQAGEMPSEGMVTGAIQVSPSGQATLFLADHPTTGGYPVIAVVVSSDLGHAAQARPGQIMRFRRVAPPTL